MLVPGQVARLGAAPALLAQLERVPAAVIESPLELRQRRLVLGSLDADAAYLLANELLELALLVGGQS